MKHATGRSLSWVIACAILMACGASANAPGEKKDAGNIPLYDGGSDYKDTDGSAGGDCTDTTTVDNCGSCGNACPGIGTTSANVDCSADAGTPECVFSCQGENYDVDDDASDGCEVADSPTANHDVGSATNLGSVSCHDDSSAQNLSGVLPSDAREHDPAVPGFIPLTGAAPDYWTIVGTGGSCYDDLNLTLTLTGTTMPSCYTLTATTTGHGPYSCTPSTTSTCSISNGSGSYDDGATIVWHVEKTCSVATKEDVAYTITGHL